jgi:hypothetical protein
MSVKIYCIEDINGLKYVGSTTQTLTWRMYGHVADKKNKNKRQCSSNQLDLEHSEIKLLEECHIDKRMEREHYWIQNTDCINIRDGSALSGKLYKRWRRSWGDERNTNSLWRIDVNLFAQ